MTNVVSKPSNKATFGGDGKLIDVEAFASELVVSYPWNKVGVGGFAGGGKSVTSAEIMAGIYLLMKEKNLLKFDAPLLIIDTEQAAQFLVEFFKSKGIPVRAKQTKSLADVQTAFDLASQGHFFGVLIDSMTHVLKDFTETWQKKNNIQKIEMRHYGIINPLWEKEFGQRMVHAQTHVVFTGRGTYDYEMVETDEDGKTKKTMERSGVKMQITKDTPFDPNLVIWMSAQQKLGKGGKPRVWREAFIMKDRNPDRATTLDGKTFGNEKTGGPKWKDFVPHFLYLLKNYNPNATVATTSTSSASLVPDPVEVNPNIRRKEVLLDEIKSLLLALYPGKKAEETKAKGDLLERHLNTRSWKVVEGMDVTTLEYGRDGIKQDVDLIRKAKESARGEYFDTVGQKEPATVEEDVP